MKQEESRHTEPHPQSSTPELSSIEMPDGRVAAAREAIHTGPLTPKQIAELSEAIRQRTEKSDVSLALDLTSIPETGLPNVVAKRLQNELRDAEIKRQESLAVHKEVLSQVLKKLENAQDRYFALRFEMVRFPSLWKTIAFVNRLLNPLNSQTGIYNPTSSPTGRQLRFRGDDGSGELRNIVPLLALTGVALVASRIGAEYLSRELLFSPRALNNALFFTICPSFILTRRQNDCSMRQPKNLPQILHATFYSMRQPNTLSQMLHATFVLPVHWIKSLVIDLPRAAQKRFSMEGRAVNSLIKMAKLEAKRSVGLLHVWEILQPAFIEAKSDLDSANKEYEYLRGGMGYWRDREIFGDSIVDTMLGLKQASKKSQSIRDDLEFSKQLESKLCSRLRKILEVDSAQVLLDAARKRVLLGDGLYPEGFEARDSLLELQQCRNSLLRLIIRAHAEPEVWQSVTREVAKLGEGGYEDRLLGEYADGVIRYLEPSLLELPGSVAHEMRSDLTNRPVGK